MSDDVLFTVTKANLETGLRGYPVGYCTTSTVDPEKGLFYATRPINTLTTWSPEKVIYLLYYGKEGSDAEIQKFSQDIAKRAFLSKETIEHLGKLPRLGDPMKLFAAALLIVGLFECKENYREDCLNLIAKVPEMVARVIHHHAGWGEIEKSRPELGLMENFAQMLKVPNGGADLPFIFKIFDILHLDHGGGNLSTFVGKAVASGLEDMYGSIASAMCALAGPRHGRANQECLLFVQETLAKLGEKATRSQVEKYIRERLEKGELIYGFGHAVLRVEDPRATFQYEYAKKHYGDHSLVKMALMIREEGTKVLKENPKISCPYPNVDAISGTLLTAAGFPYPQYYTLLFGLSRAVGIAIQIVYERLEARGGKGVPIVRPKYLYRSRS